MKQKILDRDGEVLYEDTAPSKKELIVRLVREGKSLANADLHKCDLSYCDISNGDFSGADLTDANMKGAIAGGLTIFQDAILDGVRAEGMSGRRAVFMGASVKPSESGDPTFAGAILTYSVWDEAQIQKATFDGAGLTGSRFRRAKVHRSSFRKAWFSNVDHAAAEYLENNMAEARMTPRAVAHRIPAASIPDQTRGTVAIGNTYGKTRLDGTLAAFKRDRFLGRLERGVCWSVSTAAILAGTGVIDDIAAQDTWREAFGSLAGTGFAFLMVATGANLVLERMSDKVKDVIHGSLTAIQRFVRTQAARINALGRLTKDYAVVFLTGPGREFVAHALTSESNGEPAALSHQRHQRLAGCSVILATRDRIARCLQMIGNAANDKAAANHDHLVIRRNPGIDDLPTAIKYHADGGVTGFWSHADGSVRGFVAFDHLERQIASKGDIPVVNRRADLRRQFETALICDMGGPSDFSYPFDTHEITAGRDGSVVVVQSGRSLPHNEKNGYVVIAKDGTAYTAGDAKIAARDDHGDTEETAAATPFYR